MEMSFLEKVMKQNSQRKEFGTISTPRARPVVREKAREVTIRRQPMFKSRLPNGEVLEEAQGLDELVMNSDPFADDDDMDINEFGTQSSSMNHEIITPKKTGICPFEVGAEAHDHPLEQMKTFKKRLAEATMPRLNFNYDSVNYMINEGSEETRMIGFWMRGMMEIVECQNEKFLTKKSKEDGSNFSVSAGLEPSSFLDQEPVIIDNLQETGKINVNEVLAELSAQSACLRTIIQTVANYWIEKVVPFEDRTLYSTSDKPKDPQQSLPNRFLNAPCGLLIKCLIFPGCGDASMKLEISLAFKIHVMNIFNHARSNAKNGFKKRKRDDRLADK